MVTPVGCLIISTEKIMTDCDCRIAISSTSQRSHAIKICNLVYLSGNVITVRNEVAY